METRTATSTSRDPYSGARKTGWCDPPRERTKHGYENSLRGCKHSLLNHYHIDSICLQCVSSRVAGITSRPVTPKVHPGLPEPLLGLMCWIPTQFPSAAPWTKRWFPVAQTLDPRCATIKSFSRISTTTKQIWHLWMHLHLKFVTKQRGSFRWVCTLKRSCYVQPVRCLNGKLYAMDKSCQALSIAYLNLKKGYVEEGYAQNRKS